jgi:phosphopantothenoylcysteine decarboxylase/phosphopantothenate--cysteine ligase
MNTDMWEQPSVQRNWKQVLTDPRYHEIAPGNGVLACDRIGPGRLAEPVEILAWIDSLLITHGKRDLAGKHILVSAGSTQEYLDAVRFIGNPSTGKMGIALAQAARHRGAQVTLVHGPLSPDVLTATTGIETIGVTSATEMQEALLQRFPIADWVVMAAAIADVRPHDRAPDKLPKAALPEALPLTLVPDIVAQLATHKAPHQRLVGFAAQTGDILPPAWKKLQTKDLDAIVANAIDQAGSGFGSDFNQAILLTKAGEKYVISRDTKRHVAHQIYDLLLTVSL